MDKEPALTEPPEQGVHPETDVNPEDAAAMLGMSRKQLDGLLDRGLLEHRQVGDERRVTLAAIHGFKEAERSRSRVAMDDLAVLQNELGLTE